MKVCIVFFLAAVAFASCGENQQGLNSPSRDSRAETDALLREATGGALRIDCFHESTNGNEYQAMLLLEDGNGAGSIKVWQNLGRTRPNAQKDTFRFIGTLNNLDVQENDHGDLEFYSKDSSGPSVDDNEKSNVISLQASQNSVAGLDPVAARNYPSVSNTSAQSQDPVIARLDVEIDIEESLATYTQNGLQIHTTHINNLRDQNGNAIYPHGVALPSFIGGCIE